VQMIYSFIQFLIGLNRYPYTCCERSPDVDMIIHAPSMASRRQTTREPAAEVADEDCLRLCSSLSIVNRPPVFSDAF